MTRVVITSSAFLIFLPLERSALEEPLSRLWNRSLQLSMRRKRQVSRVLLSEYVRVNPSKTDDITYEKTPCNVR